MTPYIQAYDPGAEYFFREGCHINELANSAQDPGVSIARARVEPGTSTRWHALAGIDERYVILEGQGRVELADNAADTVSPGDVVLIPANEKHWHGATEDSGFSHIYVSNPASQLTQLEA